MRNELLRIKNGVEKVMHEHIVKARLLEIAAKEIRFAKPEFDHIQKCNECLVTYAKSILEVARTNAKNKSKEPSTHRFE